jgi:hypothetical protein
MSRSKKQLLGQWVNDEGDAVWVYKSGRSYWISHGMNEQLCHPSIRSVEDTKREIFLVFHVAVSRFQSAG